MSTPTDSLEAALRAVPLRGYPSTTLPPIAGHIPATQYEVDVPALAAAAREWAREHLPKPAKAEWAKESDGVAGYNAALVAVAKDLGLYSHRSRRPSMEIVHDPGEHGESPRITRIFAPTEEPHRSLVAAITWQDGPIKKWGVNGAQMEDVLDALIERLRGFQSGAFPCHENAQALIKLVEAREWLDKRTALRREQGIEGENRSHESR